uniref:Uncharacterized protein n=1 Tax=Rhizophagus irregularis (strain DAOM 181602 / DAOM 197198 / MUCL 43194) TaxID=747089 RepID=U9T189_RHIID
MLCRFDENEDPSKRPSTSEVRNIIRNWIFFPHYLDTEDLNKEFKRIVMQFINAPIGHHNNLATESHSQAYYTSRLLDFTSKKLNEILESEDSQAYYASHFTINETVNKRPVSEDLDDCLINDMKSLDENTSKKLNEREDSQASVKVSK